MGIPGLRLRDGELDVDGSVYTYGSMLSDVVPLENCMRQAFFIAAPKKRFIVLCRPTLSF